MAYGKHDEPASVRGPFSIEVRDRLERLRDILNGASGTLAGVRERQLGPWADDPTTGAGSAAGPAKQAPLFEEVLSSLDAAIATAHRVQMHADVLNGSV